MTIITTDLGNTRESARRLRFEPTATITATSVQEAIEAASTVPATQPPNLPITSVAAAQSPYTVLATDYLLYVDSSAGPVTILLQAATARGGLPLVIKDVGGAAAANAITITPNGAETIDGLAGLVIGAAYGGFTLNPRTNAYTVAP